MPKLIDYPRTTYSGAWEVAEVTDDTGGKCAIETAARKLNRKVSGSFKAIIGSAVKFGLLTSKRDLLTTTTLFKRIKHAYDKQEELLFHREAFLTPPLFTQLCRKFRSRELPVQMLDVMLIREFNVEEINAPNVAKAFVEGCRMVGLLDEHNMVADIDALNAKQPPRRELSNVQPPLNSFKEETSRAEHDEDEPITDTDILRSNEESQKDIFPLSQHSQRTTKGIEDISQPSELATDNDAIESLFGLGNTKSSEQSNTRLENKKGEYVPAVENRKLDYRQAGPPTVGITSKVAMVENIAGEYQIQVSGPGINTTLSITDEEDISIAFALLEKMRRRFKA